MNLLVFGGTSFVGRAIAEEAISRGHGVTVFNRGIHQAPAGATQLTGDRLATDGYIELKGKTFDAVLDTWQLDPIAVERAVAVLRGKVGRYVYVSTISVYDDAKLGETERLNENSPVLDPTQEGILKYSANKRGAELALLSAGSDFPVLIARPGLILGPGEGPMRLPWWLQRLQRGGKTLAPGPEDRGLQYVDSRDLAAFLLDGVEHKLEGVFNTISEPGHSTMSELLETANGIVGGGAELVWKSPAEILEAGIKPWSELPIWLPPSPDADFVYNSDTSKAYGAGLRVRPMAETIRDTWAWLTSGDGVPSNDKPVEGSAARLDPEKEDKFLRGEALNKSDTAK